MGKFVIVAYSPKAGMNDQLMAAVGKHERVLRSERLVTDRPFYVMRGGDGTLVEVFEWNDADAIARAHSNPAVAALWAEFEAACSYRPLHTLAECQQLFANFDSVDA
jgi:hypothetical protein